jgi:uncharacterized zinc-type alcohol dehydrogenase-like protein
MTVERRDLGPHDILIEIKYSGICHSDISHARSEWRPEPYPLVPGHEFTGIVAATGTDVSQHAVGDRAGVGCMVNSCRQCANCLKGQEQYCLSGTTLTYGSVDRDGTITQGGYSTHIVVDEDFVLPIPDGIGLAEAAPLLCAGITVFSPLRRWATGPGTKVAVVGLGGLGHLAVKFAHAMGAEVTVLSQSLKKQEDGLRLGADHYYATGDPDTFKTLSGSFDLIVNTVSASIDVNAYLSLLALDGVLANVGVATEPARGLRPGFGPGLAVVAVARHRASDRDDNARVGVEDDLVVRRVAVVL